MNNETNRNPYAAPQADVSVLSNSSGDLADLGSRLGGFFLDIAIYMIVVIPMMIPAFIHGFKEGFARGSSGDVTASAPEMSSLFGILAFVGGIAFLGIFIYNLVLISQSGQTIAKKILGIKIVRTDGSQAGLGRIFWLRMVVAGLIGRIPFIGFIISIVGYCLIFRDDRRCLHDLIADTMVVRC